MEWFKRFSLIIPIIFIILVSTIKEIYNELFYLIIGFFISISIILWNIPFLILVLHTTPVYYEDLLIVSSTTNSEIHKLQNMFTAINGILSSIFITIIFAYICINFNNYNSSDKNSVINFIAFTGGLGAIYIKIQAVVGKSILSILFYIKNSEISEPGIEMVNLYMNLNSDSNITVNSSNISMFDDLSIRTNQTNNTTILNNIWLNKREQQSPIPNGNKILSDNISIQSLCANPIKE